MYLGYFSSVNNDDIEFKREINRIKMQKYRRDKMTDQQKARYKEVNRKTAATNCLKKKRNEDAKKKC